LEGIFDYRLLNNRTWLLLFGWELGSNYLIAKGAYSAVYVVLTIGKFIVIHGFFAGLVIRNRLVPHPGSLMRWYGFNNWLEQKPHGYTTLLQFPALRFDRSILF
jgi:hypothetical protein